MTPLTTSEGCAIYKVNVKALTVPLFGVLDAKDQEPFYAAFAMPGQQIAMKFDDHAFAIIEQQLGLDAEQLLPAVSRYVTGQLRAGAQGMRGWHLGDFGEALVLVLHLLRSGWTVSRVVSSHAPNRAERPMPDFWATDPAGQLCLIEVKTSEALDYVELSQASSKRLAPCRGVAPLRLKALRQLGFHTSGRDLGYHHYLEVLGRGRRQFPLLPARKGVAWVVLACDGRLKRLRAEKRFKTPPACLAKQRNCWDCIGAGPGTMDPEVLAVELPNAPGYLPLLPPGEGGSGVFEAYRRWSEALWVAEVTAVEQSSSELAFAVLGWLSDRWSGGRLRNRMGREWYDYVVEATAACGVGSKAWNNLASIALFTIDRSVPPGLRNGTARVVPPSELAALLRQPAEERTAVHLSTTLSSEAHDIADTLSLQTSPHGWSVRACSHAWWSRQSLDGKAASDVVGRVLKLLVGDRDLTWSTSNPLVLPVFTEASDSRVELGWRLVSSWEGASPLVSGDVPDWLAWLSSGDPRASLYVFKDGRLSLTVRGELPPQIGPPSTDPLPELRPPTTVTTTRLALIRSHPA